MDCPKCTKPLENPAECACGWRKDADAAPRPDGQENAAEPLVNAGGRRIELGPAGGDDSAAQKSATDKQAPPAKDKHGAQKLFEVLRGEKKSGLGEFVYSDTGQFRKVESRLSFGSVNAGQLMTGDGGVAVAVYNQLGDPSERPGAKEKTVKRSYVEVVSTLNLQSELKLPEFELEALIGHLAELREWRLLVLNCFDDALADAAVSELIGSLDPDGECRKFYLHCDRDRRNSAESDVGIELFSSREADSQTPSIVLVDASGKRGTPFLESLVGNRQTAWNLSGDLESNNLWLICRGNSAHLRRRVSEDGALFFFPCWEMDCLPELLQRHFPDRHGLLRDRIERQRREGKWPEDDGAVCSRVRGLIAGGRLDEELEGLEHAEAPARRENYARAGFIRSHFKGGDSVEDTVLYVAAYFPDLNPHEFNRVVSALLEGLTTKVAVPAPKPAAAPDDKAHVRADDKTGGQPPAPGPSGPEPEPFVWEEQPLLRSWQDKADEILGECRLETVVGKDSGRRLDFKDPALRHELRAYLEAERGFYLRKQFERVLRLGLLFDRSLNISEGVIDVTVNTALESPDTFSRDWLYDMVTALSPLIEAAGQEVVSADGAAYRPALPADVEAAMRVIYSTVARLVRKMLEHPPLEKSLSTFFMQLMATGQHEAALEIVRRLQTSRQVEMRWIRQLFDQGNETIRLRTYFALYERVWQRDAGIYEVLQALESWLPEGGRESFNYSPSNQYALRLMFEYCLNSTAEFESKFYGSWPSRYPLLATPAPGTPEGSRAAGDNLRLLANWLFHPGLKEVLTEEEDGETAENLNVSLGALLAEWTVILLGADVADGQGVRGAPPAPPPDEAVAVFDLLLRKVIAATTRAQQNELLACWESLADYFLWHLTTRGPQSGEPHRPLSRRRNWVRYLIKRFKVLRRQAA